MLDKSILSGSREKLETVLETDSPFVESAGLPARDPVIRRDRSFRFKKRDLRSNKRGREQKRRLGNSKFKIQKSTGHWIACTAAERYVLPGFDSKFYLQSF